MQFINLHWEIKPPSRRESWGWLVSTISFRKDRLLGREINTSRFFVQYKVRAKGFDGLTLRCCLTRPLERPTCQGTRIAKTGVLCSGAGCLFLLWIMGRTWRTLEKHLSRQCLPYFFPFACLFNFCICERLEKRFPMETLWRRMIDPYCPFQSLGVHIRSSSSGSWEAEGWLRMEVRKLDYPGLKPNKPGSQALNWR